MDTQCGFKAFPAEVVRRITPDSLEKGFAFDIELLLRTELGAPGSTTRVPIAWVDSAADSTTTDMDPYLPMLQSIVTLYRHYLPADPDAEEFAEWIESLDEAAWNRLLDAIPAAIAEADPADFTRSSPVSVAQLARRTQS